MSKIICDVCGTSYPETAQQCPICGCARPSDAKPVVVENRGTNTVNIGNYTYVKGGRFSKANVKKRNRAAQASPAQINAQRLTEQKKTGKIDGFLVAIVVILLLAIVAVVSYIAMRVFFPGILPSEIEKPSVNLPNPIVTTAPSETTSETTVPVICTGLTLSKTEIEFDKQGSILLLNVILEPENTSEEVVFTSTDTNVVSVTSDGKVEAIGPGEASITATCGQIVAECRVKCTFTIPETSGATTEPVYSTEDFKLNRTDFTMTKKNETHVLYTGKIPLDSITWTSENTNVATVVNGKVTAVCAGMTNIYAEYSNVKLTCIVRCAASVGAAPVNTEQNDGQLADTPYNISTTDVTISVDEEFKLQLLDSERKSVSVTWIVADASICSVSSSTIKGLKTGTTTVSVSYEGYTYTCTVRVK